MFSLLTTVLTLFLIVSVFLPAGPLQTPQTVVPTPAGAISPTNPISPTQPITRSISPEARVAMSVTIGTSRAISLTTTAFLFGGMIPTQYTCDGQNTNPPLSWTGAPADAKSLALTMEDPDAPSGLFVHWVIFNMPPTLTGLPAAVPTEPKLPDGTIQGLNGAKKPGYVGPCPPSGTHRYFWRIYALDTMLNLPETANRDDLFKAVEGHVLAWGQLNSEYQRGS